ncbi:MAG: formate/nitrite transporter family protein [Spirochaetaceae bacterium]|jgi:nitrite transporter NirC|nr:formate/nitrite transporter family protein [Spirochaetaceae bacterium]
MFVEEFTAAGNAAKAKCGLLSRNPAGYFFAAMLAGIYVGLGILLIFSLGGQLAGAPYTKLIMGVSFSIALSLVVIAGAELFTGNNLVGFAGIVQKTINTGQLVKLWIVCFLGNWVGSIIVAALFYAGGLSTGAVGEFIAATAAAKMNAAPLALFFRAVLCNTLVCLAVWSGFRCKSDSGKLIMIFWCLFAFITSGYEHSIANMTLLTAALFAPFKAAVTLSGYFYNLGIVTLGNMAGGVFCVTLPYALISRQKES